jgi:hypothetical protein
LICQNFASRNLTGGNDSSKNIRERKHKERFHIFSLSFISACVLVLVLFIS